MTNQKQDRPSRLEFFIMLFSFLSMVVLSFFPSPFNTILVVLFFFVFGATNIFSMNRVYKTNKSADSPPFPLGLSVNAFASFVVLFTASWIFEVSPVWQKVLLFYVAVSAILVPFYFLFKLRPRE